MLRFGTLERLALSLKFEGACCSGLSRSTSASVSSVASPTTGKEEISASPGSVSGWSKAQADPG